MIFKEPEICCVNRNVRFPSSDNYRWKAVRSMEVVRMDNLKSIIKLFHVLLCLVLLSGIVFAQNENGPLPQLIDADVSMEYRVKLKTKMLGRDEFDIRHFTVEAIPSKMDSLYGYHWLIKEYISETDFLAYMYIHDSIFSFNSMNSSLTIYYDYTTVPYREYFDHIRQMTLFDEYVFELSNAYPLDTILKLERIDRVGPGVQLHYSNALNFKRVLDVDTTRHHISKVATIYTDSSIQSAQVIESEVYDFKLDLATKGEMSYFLENIRKIQQSGVPIKDGMKPEKNVSSPKRQISFVEYAHFYNRVLNQSLTELNVRYVLLDFWFTSCTPCIRSIPKIVKFCQALPPGTIYLLGVNGVEYRDRKILQNKLRDRFPGFESIFVERQELKDLSIEIFPTYILLDTKNKTVSYRGSKYLSVIDILNEMSK